MVPIGSWHGANMLPNRSKPTQINVKSKVWITKENMRSQSIELELLFDLISTKKDKYHPTKYETKRSRKNMQVTPKGFQNVTLFDANTHQQSMPKAVPKKNMNRIRNHVFSYV